MKPKAKIKMDDDKIKEIMRTDFEIENNMSMQILHRIWFRNILYYMGEQWFEWAKSELTFRRIMPNVHTPTPVSNMIRDFVRSMKALILNKDFVIKIWPNSNDQDDIEASEMGENFLRWLEASNDEVHLDEREIETIWMVICGTAFDRTFPVLLNGDWAIDNTGSPITKGDIISESVSPFNMVVDIYGRTMKQKRRVGIKGLKPREWVEDTFKIKLNTSDGDEGPAVNYERRLSRLVANVSPWKGDGLDRTEPDADEDLVIFKEMEFKPTKEYPQGLYVGFVGSQQCFKHERLPIPVSKEGDWHYTFTDMHYHFVPGRYWSDGGVNDLISPQNTVNQIDQDLEINRKGVGRPIVMMPTDVNMKKLSRFGQSLLVLQYDSFLSGGQRPTIERGTSLPGQVLDEREIHRMVSQDVAGDPKNVLRGNTPSTQASGIMVDILRDAAEQGHLPDVERFYRSQKRIKRKQLILAQEVYTEERMIKIPDEGGGAKVTAFKGADLRNNTDIRLELASGVASTRAGQTQMLLNLTEGGFFSAESDLDPEYRQDILKRMGLTGFKDKRNIDMERAQAENQILTNIQVEDMEIAVIETPPQEEGGEPGLMEIPIVRGLFLSIGEGMDAIVISEDPLFKYDNHGVHYEIHRRYLLSNEFRHLDPELQAAAIKHTDLHKEIIDLQAAEAMQKEAVIAGEAEKTNRQTAALDAEEIAAAEGQAGP